MSLANGIITPGLTVKFNRITGNIELTDTTDWAGQGFAFPANSPANGYLKITYQLSGSAVTLYDNITSPGAVDFDIPNSYDNQNTIAIPLDSDGLPLPAKYTVEYYLKVTNGIPVDPTQGILIQEFTYDFVDPEICISGVVNCSASTLTSDDVTDYAVSGATLTTLTRAHSIYPPPASAGSQLGPVDLKALTMTPIYTTTNTAEVISTVVYTLDDGLVVTATLSGTKEIDVVCDTSLSNVLCCLFQIDKNYTNYSCNSPVKAQNYFDTVVQPSWTQLLLFLAAMQSGNETKAGAAYAALMEASGCEDCDCTDDIQIVQQINGGPGNTVYAVTSPDGSISVNTVSGGGTTTFQIQVGAALQTIINNSYNSVVVSGSPEITVTPSGTNPKTYTITFNTGAGNVQRVDRLIEISRNLGWTGAGTPLLNVVMTEVETRGSDVDAFGNNVLTLGGGVNNQPADKAVFQLTNYITSAKPHTYNVQLNQILASTPVLTYAGLGATNFNVEGWYCDQASSSGDLFFRITSPITGGACKTVNDLWVLCNNNNTIKLGLTILIEE